MLEFSYDGKVQVITASANCILDYALVGGGGGGGGSDAGHIGSYGISGDRQLGQVYLSAGQSVYCIVGSGGIAGLSNVHGGGGGLGGAGEYYNGSKWGGGTGGNAGPSGASGSGGGGGGATTLRYSDGTKICAAAGGGGGGGAGNNSDGFIKSYSFYLAVQNSNVEAGGKGQDHQGDGGGAGGGGGGYISGAGGVQPAGDYGAMSGSSGTSYNINPTINQTFYTTLDVYAPWILAGSGGANGINGGSGYAAFSSKQVDLRSLQSGTWTSAQYIAARSNNAWKEVSDVYVKNNGSWVRVYGNNIPSATSSPASMSSETGPMIPYPPPIIVPIQFFADGAINSGGGGRGGRGGFSGDGASVGGGFGMSGGVNGIGGQGDGGAGGVGGTGVG